MLRYVHQKALYKKSHGMNDKCRKLNFVWQFVTIKLSFIGGMMMINDKEYQL